MFHLKKFEEYFQNSERGKDKYILATGLEPGTNYNVHLFFKEEGHCGVVAGSNSCSVDLPQITGIGTNFKTLPITNQPQPSLLTQKLKLGSRGEQVKILEQFLFDGGYLDITPDTYFGTSTRKAVQAFQREQGMTPDGSVGPKTRSIINGLLDK